jgi:flagellar biosynthetic protein FliP
VRLLKTALIALCSLLFLFNAAHVMAAPVPLQVNVDQVLNSQSFSNSINLLLAISAISLIPFFLMSTTSFLRIIIVLGMIRSAIGTQQVPPAPVIVSLAMFMTLYIMSPVWNDVYTQAIEPYNQGRISQQAAFEKGLVPIRKFMLRQTREKDLALFVEQARIKAPTRIEEVPTYVLIPAFLISELKTAFQISFVIFIPFVIIDLVVSNILLSLGMFMLSPVLVSLPFKILLFVLTDGWFVITRGLMQSFHY